MDDPDQQTDEVIAALNAFIERSVYPAWFTLNLSCPNTEDDPTGHQTADGAQPVVRGGGRCARWGVLQYAPTTGGEVNSGAIPLWVKLGPNLSDAQSAR